METKKLLAILIFLGTIFLILLGLTLFGVFREREIPLKLEGPEVAYLQILKTEPLLLETEFLPPAAPIIFTFSEVLTLEKIFWEITPEIKLLPVPDKTGTVLILKPEKLFTEDQIYTLRFLKKTTSQKGHSLEKDAVFTFKAGYRYKEVDF